LGAIILLAGVGLRLATLILPHAFVPDEIFQYLEPAHRLAFGWGVVPWEYREHIRSWLVPLALAAPMRFGGVIAPDGGLYLLFTRLTLLAISLMTIPAAGMIGRRISALHALFAMLVASTWAEFVFFSTVALTEPLATCVFLAAAALFYRYERPKRATLLGAGALLALTCLVRFQYGPAAIAFGAATSIRQPRQIFWLIAGGLPVLGVSAAVDMAMGDWPFGWLMGNLHHNIMLGRSSLYGVTGPFFYPAEMAAVWGLWLTPILLLAGLGARRYPALLLAALTNFVIHDMIAHKEYRFLLLTTMLLVILAGIGTADAIRWARRRSPGRWKHLPLIAAGGWLAASASAAASGPMSFWWDQQQNQLSTFAALRDTANACGVAIFGFDWTGSGGYTYLHRPIPLFAYARTERAELQRDAAQFDAIVTPKSLVTPAAFTDERCFASAGRTTMCIRIRSGKCAAPDSPAEINRQLIRLNR
jgi:hypothetical protein